MIAAVMQPYFLPYIGYFQLMSAVDVFVFFDDVQYINHGWVNRNRIRVNRRPAWLTLPVRRESSMLEIRQRSYLLDPQTIERVERRVGSAYREAPHHDEAMRLVKDVLGGPDSNVASFNIRQLRLLADLLGITCRFESSARIGTTAHLKGQDRVIELSRRLGASHYVNPIGGTALYDPDAFARARMGLSFLETSAAPAFLDDGHAHLSVIDGLMHEGCEAMKRHLTEYHLVAPN